MHSEIETQLVCPNCGSKQVLDFKFCNRCGSRNPSKARNERRREEKFLINMKFLAAYVTFSIIFLIAYGITEDSLQTLVIWTILFAILDLVFAFLQPKVWKLFIPKQVEIKPLILTLVLGVFSGLIISFLMGNLNLILFEESYSDLTAFLDSKFPLLFGILIIAIFPAIFEELAFRGFIFNNLKSLSGKKSAIWGSSFLFALVHFSLLSLFWLIPFGLILSYLRNKYSTLLYGILGHFTHNATTVLIEYYGIL